MGPLENGLARLRSRVGEPFVVQYVRVPQSGTVQRGTVRRTEGRRGSIDVPAELPNPWGLASIGLLVLLQAQYAKQRSQKLCVVLRV